MDHLHSWTWKGNQRTQVVVCDMAMMPHGAVGAGRAWALGLYQCAECHELSWGKWQGGAAELDEELEEEWARV